MIIIQSIDGLEVKIPNTFNFKCQHRSAAEVFLLEIYAYGIIVYLQTKDKDISKIFIKKLQNHKEDNSYTVRIFVDELRNILKITNV